MPYNQLGTNDKKGGVQDSKKGLQNKFKNIDILRNSLNCFELRVQICLTNEFA